MFYAILVFVAVLGLLVFIHELGHFAMAKFLKIGVEEFGFGWPPRIFGFKKGETIYSLNWIPIGGFVKIKGIVGAEEGDGNNEDYHNDKNSFINRPIWQRFSVLFAGVFMNFCLAALLFAVGFMVGMPSAVNNVNENANIKNQQVAILEILPNSPAATANLEAGDKILRINNNEIKTIDDFKKQIKQNSQEEQINLTFQRNKEEIEKEVGLTEIEEIENVGIGVALSEIGLVSYPWYQAIYEGFAYTGKLTILIIKALGGIFTSLFSSEKSLENFSGPVGIAVMTNQMAQMGLIYLLQFTALISINLAIFNLLPLPALDGGRLMFLIIEKIKGGPINQKMEIIVHNLGFYFLLLLLVVVTFRDIFKYEVFSYIKDIFI